MQICFGILSSSTNGQIIDQLIELLDQNSKILIHHDFSQKPDFNIASNRAIVLENYTKTNWGHWSQVEAIIKLLRYAVQHTNFDYFQLLSETCLPIRPINEFKKFLSDTRPDACIGLIRVADKIDDLGAANFAWRCYARSHFMRRVIESLSRQFLDRSGIKDPSKRIVNQGVSVNKKRKLESISDKVLFSIYRVFFNLLLKLLIVGTPFNKKFDCYIGSTWFCLSRKVVEYALNQLDQHPEIIEHYRKTFCPDESFLHAIIGSHQGFQIVDINHYISWGSRESGPDELNINNIGDIADSGKFFARKFAKNVNDPLRMKISVRARASR